MGQSKASYNFLNIKEINLWNWHWTTFTPSLNLDLRSWIFVVAWNKFIYDHLGEKQWYRLFCSLPIIKEVYFTCWEKDYMTDDWCLITRLMFNNLTKLMQILTKKNSMQQILLHFSSSTGSIKIFSRHKKTSSNIRNVLK